MDRRSGTLLGMGIGLAVAFAVFGMTRLFGNNLEGQLRADVAQLSAPETSPSATPVPSASSLSPPPSDSLLDRLNRNPLAADQFDIPELSETIADVFRRP